MENVQCYHFRIDTNGYSQNSKLKEKIIDFLNTYASSYILGLETGDSGMEHLQGNLWSSYSIEEMK